MIFLIAIPTVTRIVSLICAMGVVIRLCGWWSGSNRYWSNRSSSGLDLDSVKWQKQCYVILYHIHQLSLCETQTSIKAMEHSNAKGTMAVWLIWHTSEVTKRLAGLVSTWWSHQPIQHGHAFVDRRNE